MMGSSRNLNGMILKGPLRTADGRIGDYMDGTKCCIMAAKLVFQSHGNVAAVALLQPFSHSHGLLEKYIVSLACLPDTIVV